MRDRVAEHRGELHVDPRDPCLSGHFPEQSVVPAATILDRLADWLEPVAGARVAGVERARFKAALLPGTTWEVTAVVSAEPRAKVTCRHQGLVTMTATFVLEEPAA